MKKKMNLTSLANQKLQHDEMQNVKGAIFIQLGRHSLKLGGWCLCSESCGTYDNSNDRTLEQYLGDRAD